MTGKRAESSMENKAYIKAKSLLGLKPVDIHREVCDISGEGQISYKSVCWWIAKFKAGVTQRNDPPYKMTPRVILLRRGMTRVIILRRKMTPDRRKRTPSSCSRMTPS